MDTRESMADISPPTTAVDPIVPGCVSGGPLCAMGEPDGSIIRLPRFVVYFARRLLGSCARNQR